MEGKMICVAVDSHKKRIEVVPLNHATSATTINYLRDMFSRFGVQRTLVSDNGTQFTSNEFAIFVDRNITHLRTAPFHPLSNGAAVERAVRTIKDGLRKVKGWTLEHNLTRLLLNYRSTQQKTGKSPAEMLLGYKIRSRLDTCFPASAGPNANEESDKLLPPVTCYVHVRNYGPNGKWIPGRVTAPSGGRMITVETPQASVRRHIDQVHPRMASPQGEPSCTSPDTNSKDNTLTATPFSLLLFPSPDDAAKASPREVLPDIHQHALAAVPTPTPPGTNQQTTQPLRRPAAVV
nr:uncharacterized protein LOC119176643 [Rhipicephalus microplus]